MMILVSSKAVSFDLACCVVFDLEVYAGHWCVGFHGPNAKGKLTTFIVDGDRNKLAKTLDQLQARGAVLVGYNSERFDVPLARCILAGIDPYAPAQAIIERDELPPRSRSYKHSHATISTCPLDSSVPVGSPHSRTWRRIWGSVGSGITLRSQVGAHRRTMGRSETIQPGRLGAHLATARSLWSRAGSPRAAVERDRQGSAVDTNAASGRAGFRPGLLSGAWDETRGDKRRPMRSLIDRCLVS